MRLIFPIAIPLATAILGRFAWRWRTVQRGLGIAGAAALLLASLELLKRVWQQGPQATWVGNWPAPFGITLIADLLSAIMVVLAAVIGFAVALYALAHIDPAREAFGFDPEGRQQQKSDGPRDHRRREGTNLQRDIGHVQRPHDPVE